MKRGVKPSGYLREESSRQMEQQMQSKVLMQVLGTSRGTKETGHLRNPVNKEAIIRDQIKEEAAGAQILLATVVSEFYFVFIGK